ncbi:unnamed protein product [Leuciscus chuanchicus]
MDINANSIWHLGNLTVLCKRANENFKDVRILRLRSGSVVAESVAEYNYPNNNSQITSLNTNLGPTLEKIFNDSNSLKNLSAALGDFPIEVGQIAMETAEVLNISDLKPFVICTENFANFTEEVVNEEWEYHGDHCELYRRKAGFYAVLFGSLAAFALLIIVAVVMVVVFYRAK